MDYLNRPEVAAKNSNFIQYASGNLSAQASLASEVKNDPGIYPPAAVLSRLYTITPYDEKTQKSANRLWTRVKTGR
jgi:putrescine transport system substrate-binding protein